MSDAPERIVPSCVEALESYQQADMEGVMVLASRQAIHETIDAYWARVKTCEELEAKLSKAMLALDEAIYLLDPDDEDIAKGTGLHRIVTTYKELKVEKPTA